MAPDRYEICSKAAGLLLDSECTGALDSAWRSVTSVAASTAPADDTVAPAASRRSGFWDSQSQTTFALRSCFLNGLKHALDNGTFEELLESLRTDGTWSTVATKETVYEHRDSKSSAGSRHPTHTSLNGLELQESVKALKSTLLSSLNEAIESGALEAVLQQVQDESLAFEGSGCGETAAMISARAPSLRASHFKGKLLATLEKALNTGALEGVLQELLVDEEREQASVCRPSSAAVSATSGRSAANAPTAGQATATPVQPESEANPPIAEAVHEDTGDLVALRVEIASLFADAFVNGKLEEAISELMRPAPTHDAEDSVRLADVTVAPSAAADGASVPPKDGCQVVFSSEHGMTAQLSSSEIREQCRGQLLTNLLQAAESGALEAILMEAQIDEESDPVSGGAESFEQEVATYERASASKEAGSDAGESPSAPNTSVGGRPVFGGWSRQISGGSGDSGDDDRAGVEEEEAQDNGCADEAASIEDGEADQVSEVSEDIKRRPSGPPVFGGWSRQISGGTCDSGDDDRGGGEEEEAQDDDGASSEAPLPPPLPQLVEPARPPETSSPILPAVVSDRRSELRLAFETALLSGSLDRLVIETAAEPPEPPMAPSPSEGPIDELARLIASAASSAKASALAARPASSRMAAPSAPSPAPPPATSPPLTSEGPTAAQAVVTVPSVPAPTFDGAVATAPVAEGVDTLPSAIEGARIQRAESGPLDSSTVTNTLAGASSKPPGTPSVPAPTSDGAVAGASAAEGVDSLPSAVAHARIQRAVSRPLDSSPATNTLAGESSQPIGTPWPAPPAQPPPAARRPSAGRTLASPVSLAERLLADAHLHASTSSPSGGRSVGRLIQEMRTKDRRIIELTLLVMDAERCLAERDSQCQQMENMLVLAKGDLAHMELDFDACRSKVEREERRTAELQARERQLEERHFAVSSQTAKLADFGCFTARSGASSQTAKPADLNCMTSRSEVSTSCGMVDSPVVASPPPMPVAAAKY